MTSIDRKFLIAAKARRSGKTYNEDNSVLFLAKDRAFLLTLPDYLRHCEELGAGTEQLEAVRLMIARVNAFQEENPSKVPDVDPVEEADALLP